MANTGSRIISVPTGLADYLEKLKKYPNESFSNLIKRYTKYPEKEAPKPKKAKPSKVQQMRGISIPIKLVEHLDRLKVSSKESYSDVIKRYVKYPEPPKQGAKAD